MARLEALRVLLAITCIGDLKCHQMDLKAAFLYGQLQDEVYLKRPQGMEVEGSVQATEAFVKP